MNDRDNEIFGFYEEIQNPNNELVVFIMDNNLTIRLPDDTITSIYNIWATQGESILKPNVKVHFENGIEIDFRINELILYKSPTERLIFKKISTIKGYKYYIGNSQIYGWTCDDQVLYGFAVSNDNIVQTKVSQANISNLKINFSNELEKLSTEETEKVYEFHKSNERKISVQEGLKFGLDSK